MNINGGLFVVGGEVRGGKLEWLEFDTSILYE
jgi:hypothetical protein